MKCLFIDTSSSVLSLAIIDNNHIKAIVNYNDIKEHSKYAMIGLVKIFKIAKLKPHHIDRIIVITGPGSFTGIRIGLTIAKVYAWALNKELIPVSILKAYALAKEGFDYYITILEAKKGYAYLGIYDRFYKGVKAEQYIEIKDIKTHLMNLDGSLAINSNIELDKQFKASDLKLDFKKTASYFTFKDVVNPHKIVPNYLKPLALTKQKSRQVH